LYSSFGNNFVKTIIRLGKERGVLNIVCDQIGSPTYAKDLAWTMLDIAYKASFGSYDLKPEIYHYTNEGICSWYDFAIEILKIAGIGCKVNPVETQDYPLPAKRPFYSVLNKSKIKSTFGITIPHWKDSLERCIKAIGNQQPAKG
jgi:dTDP-4-dehydrorhamnose reductase